MAFVGFQGTFQVLFHHHLDADITHAARLLPDDVQSRDPSVSKLVLTTRYGAFIPSRFP